MIFQYTLERVLSGAKTATSRLVKPGESAEYADDARIEAVKTHGRDKYRVGKIYAVQPSRNEPAVARIRLLGIKRQRVSETSAEEAKMEGFDSREAFFAQWRDIHGKDKLNAEVWLLTFELVLAE
jgi:hypothetical protein